MSPDEINAEAAVWQFIGLICIATGGIGVMLTLISAVFQPKDDSDDEREREADVGTLCGGETEGGSDGPTGPADPDSRSPGEDGNHHGENV